MFRSLSIATVAMTLAAGCGAGKTAPTDDFSSLAGADTKSDSFSHRWQLEGSLGYGDTSNAVAYHNPPRYRAFSFTGAKGDPVDVWVRSTDGDSVAWLLNSRYGIVTSNDDADDTTTDSHYTTNLPADGTYYIAFREYSLSDATFTVELKGPSAPDFYSCKVDADCVPTPKVGCCHNGYLEAVNQNEVDAYQASFTCPNPNPICPQFLVYDMHVAQCNNGTHKCELVLPQDIRCGGFLLNGHQCTPDYTCVFNPPGGDIPGTCVHQCPAMSCPSYQHFDSTTCACADNAFCGGIAARPCTDPSTPNCINDPRSSCDPNNGGADCGGICARTCFDNVLCILGYHWDRVACGCIPN